MKEPKYKEGQKVTISIPRNDFCYKFDGLVGTIVKINTLTKDPEYKLRLEDGDTPGVHFLERDLEPYFAKKE